MTLCDLPFRLSYGPSDNRLAAVADRTFDILMGESVPHLLPGDRPGSGFV